MKDDTARRQIEFWSARMELLKMRVDCIEQKFAALLEWIGIYPKYQEGHYTIEDPTEEEIREAFENIKEFRRIHR